MTLLPAVPVLLASVAQVGSAFSHHISILCISFQVWPGDTDDTDDTGDNDQILDRIYVWYHEVGSVQGNEEN